MFHTQTPTYCSFLSIEKIVVWPQPRAILFPLPLSCGARTPSSFRRDAIAFSDVPATYISKMRRTMAASGAQITRTLRGCSGCCGFSSGTVEKP
ncbi:MAG TPA: hypothetical protein VHK47_21090 [Polyangia bacterium]|nr:hypothetical protein [Polyangia bacterium]